ncbi:MAG: hypothetical protein IPP67_04710 [Rhodospirillaceae bacterium]|nr:hypothetical protein [Rhodospirillaceae bacterium]
MPKLTELTHHSIRLDKQTFYRLKMWIADKLNDDGKNLTQKDLYILLVKSFLAKPHWQEEILDDIELRKKTFSQLSDDPDKVKGAPIQQDTKN